jgi:hypothetical protein
MEIVLKKKSRIHYNNVPDTATQGKFDSCITPCQRAPMLGQPGKR